MTKKSSALVHVYTKKILNSINKDRAWAFKAYHYILTLNSTKYPFLIENKYLIFSHPINFFPIQYIIRNNHYILKTLPPIAYCGQSKSNPSIESRIAQYN